MSDFKIIDSYSEQRETIISSEIELWEILNQMTKNDPKVVLLASPDSGILTLGIGQPYGFVEYMKEDGTPPYLIALNNTVANEEYIEFDSGGTPTPIPRNRCLPINQILEIALFFFNNKTLPKQFTWGEV